MGYATMDALAQELRDALDLLSSLTTDGFATGGDRPAREAIARALSFVAPERLSEYEAEDYLV